LSASEAILLPIFKEEAVLPTRLFVAFNEFIEEYVPEHPVAIQKVREAYDNLLEYIPPGYLISVRQLKSESEAGYRPPTMSVPFYDILTKPGEAILDFVGPFFHKETKEAGLFVELRKQLLENENDASGITNADRVLGRKDVVGVDQYEAETPELIRLYLRHTPFYEFFNTQIQWSIPDAVRPEHILMIASTGSGKTQYIQQDIFTQLSRPNPPGMVVIDSQNQMIPKLERLEAARDRIVIIDPFDEEPPALNMFIAPKRNYDANLKEAIENETLQQFAWIFSALDQELTGRMTTLFTFTSRILLAMAPHSNMMTLLDLLRIEKPAQLKASQFWPLIERADDQSRYFFDERFCTADYNKTKAGVADRLLGIMRVPAFNRMFMATDNRLDLYSELAQRKLIVFNTQKRKLGPDASAVLGRYAIAMYIRSAFEREADRAPPPAFLYIDEASEYFGKRDSSDTLFTQLRKYNCGTFVAFQDVSQLQQQTGTLIANTATKLAARVSPADASVLSSAMRTSAEHLLGIQKRPGVFQFAAFIKDIMPHALTVTFPYGVVENALQLTNEEHHDLRIRNRERLKARPRTQEIQSETKPSYTEMPKQRGGHFKEVPPSQPADASTGADQTSKNIPQQPEKATKRELSDLSNSELMVTVSRPLETLLETTFGAQGLGLHQKVKSVEDKFPFHILRQAYFIARIRNNVLHNQKFVLHPRARSKFLECAKKIGDHFALTYEPETLPQESMRPPKHGKRRTPREHPKPQDRELPDGRRAKGTAAPEPVIKPGKSWD
jgi:hypothetical protein